MQKHKLIVIDEHTLGSVFPEQPNQAQILGASILRGALDTMGIIPIQFKKTRPATLADFETFRVHPAGFVDDPARYEMQRVPDLEPHCGSWIVTRLADSEVIGEFFDRAIVERFNPLKVKIETAAQYLGRINAEIREQQQ
jgi:hypothetical protein